MKLSNYVGSFNQDRCLIMRGLPFKITISEIIEFFQNHAIFSQENVFIEEANGKRTGSALVIFENQSVAE